MLVGHLPRLFPHCRRLILYTKCRNTIVRVLNCWPSKGGISSQIRWDFHVSISPRREDRSWLGYAMCSRCRFIVHRILAQYGHRCGQPLQEFRLTHFVFFAIFKHNKKKFWPTLVKQMSTNCFFANSCQTNEHYVTNCQTNVKTHWTFAKSCQTNEHVVKMLIQFNETLSTLNIL